MSLRLSTAPHIRSVETTKRLMRDVIIALMPAALIGIYYFGPNAALLVGLSSFTAVITEYLWQKAAKKPVCVGDLSALVTGLLLGLNLPSTAPWWLAVIGSFLAIVLVKQLFGGLGHNFMNPALTSRAILLASWPVRMTTFVMPTYFAPVDAVASATPMGGLPASTLELFLGTIPGTIGEVCKAAILLGLIYLIVRGTVYPHVPTIFLFVTALLSWALGTEGGFTFNGDPLAAILSGGVMFAAVFMATDYATSPMTKKGQVIFAAGCGLIVSIIRTYSKLPEGATYAILLMNIATPLIDKYIKPVVYGTQKAVKGVKADA